MNISKHASVKSYMKDSNIPTAQDQQCDLTPFPCHFVDHGQREVVGEGPGSECQGRAAGPAAARLATCPVHQRSGEGPRGAGGRTGDPALREGPPLSGGRTRPVRTCEAAFRSAEEPRRRGPAAPRLPAREAHGREQNRAFVDEACAHRFNHWPFGGAELWPGSVCRHHI